MHTIIICQTQNLTFLRDTQLITNKQNERVIKRERNLRTKREFENNAERRDGGWSDGV